MTAKKATHQLTKQHNRDLVLQMIFERDTISRAEIARQTMLTRTTVSEVVAGLIAEGLVQEVGQGESQGGKPSILLGLAADSRYLIGVNLTQEKFIASIVNLRGEIKETVEIPVPDGDGDHALQQLYCVLDELVKTAWKPVVGIGVGAPGLINTREGTIVKAVNLDWEDLPLAHLLEGRYRLPVLVLNDSQATAIGEFVYGDHASDSNLIVVTVKHGIGAGILINGRLFQGDGGSAGEIGHVVVQEGGELCRCGRRGCLETLSSARAVTQRAQRLYQSAEPASLDGLVARFTAGDPLARQVVLEAAEYLGKSLGGLAGALNIQKIVLTGDMTRFGQPWLDAVGRSLTETVFSSKAHETTLEIGQLDYRACILGSAACLLLDGYSILFNQ